MLLHTMTDHHLALLAQGMVENALQRHDTFTAREWEDLRMEVMRRVHLQTAQESARRIRPWPSNDYNL